MKPVRTPKIFSFVEDCCGNQWCANSGGDRERCIITNWCKHMHMFLFVALFAGQQSCPPGKWVAISNPDIQASKLLLSWLLSAGLQPTAAGLRYLGLGT